MLDMAAFAQGHLWAAVARWEPEEGKEKAFSPFTRGLDDNIFRVWPVKYRETCSLEVTP